MTSGLRTFRGSIVGGADISAAITVVVVGSEVDFTTVGGVVVTIGEAGVTSGNRATSVGAKRGAISDSTSGITATTMLQRSVGVDFAAVCVVSVTVTPRCDAARDSTTSTVTNRNAIGHCTCSIAIAAGGDAGV